MEGGRRTYQVVPTFHRFGDPGQYVARFGLGEVDVVRFANDDVLQRGDMLQAFTKVLRIEIPNLTVYTLGELGDIESNVEDVEVVVRYTEQLSCICPYPVQYDPPNVASEKGVGSYRIPEKAVELTRGEDVNGVIE